MWVCLAEGEHVPLCLQVPVVAKLSGPLDLCSRQLLAAEYLSIL